MRSSDAYNELTEKTPLATIFFDVSYPVKGLQGVGSKSY